MMANGECTALPAAESGVRLHSKLQLPLPVPDACPKPKELSEDQPQNDVTIRFVSPDGSTGDVIRANRRLLVSCSEVFRAMFASGMAEASDDVIDIDDIQPETFQLMLRLIGSKQLNITFGDASTLMYVANKYLIVNLVDRCIDALSSGFSIDNVCAVLEQGNVLNIPRLQSACLSYIGYHVQRFIQTGAFFQFPADTLEKLLQQDRLDFADEVEVYEACAAWARRRFYESTRADNPTDQQIREQLGDIINRIRFPTMNFAQFAELAATRDVLTDDEKAAVFVYMGTRPHWDADVLRFDRKRRLFPVCVTRFQQVSPLVGYLSNVVDSGLDFSVSADAVLFAVGLYGGRGVQGQRHEHEVSVTVYEGNRLVSATSTTRMQSDGSDVPVKVPLDQVVEVKACMTYTIVVGINGPSSTYCGVQTELDVSLGEKSNAVNVHFDSPNTGVGVASNVPNGQIPQLYLYVDC